MKTSDSDLKVNRNMYPDAVTCDRMRLIGPKCDIAEYAIAVCATCKLLLSVLNLKQVCETSLIHNENSEN